MKENLDDLLKAISDRDKELNEKVKNENEERLSNISKFNSTFDSLVRSTIEPYFRTAKKKLESNGHTIKDYDANGLGAFHQRSYLINYKRVPKKYLNVITYGDSNKELVIIKADYQGGTFPYELKPDEVTKEKIEEILVRGIKVAFT